MGQVNALFTVNVVPVSVTLPLGERLATQGV
jgi:hypothetical protein